MMKKVGASRNFFRDLNDIDGCPISRASKHESSDSVMHSLGCPNVDTQLAALQTNVRYRIGRCSCQENQIKFKSRRNELLLQYSQLATAEGDYCKNTPKQHEARSILEEVMKVDVALEISEHCKNVFSSTTCCQLDQCSFNMGVTNPISRAPQPLNYCYEIDRTTECSSSGVLPEFLLSPMKKHPPIAAKKPKLPDIRSFENQQCYEPNEFLSSPLPCKNDNSPAQIHPGSLTCKKCRMCQQYPRCLGQVQYKGSALCFTDCGGRCSICSQAQRTGGCCSNMGCCVTGREYHGQGSSCCWTYEHPYDDKCVMVYGFHPWCIQNIDRVFSMVGGVTRKKLSKDGNWALFWYDLEYDASRACSYNLCRINGSIIGVTRWKSGYGREEYQSSATSANADVSLIRARQNLRMVNGKLEEFRSTPKRIIVPGAHKSPYGSVAERPTMQRKAYAAMSMCLVFIFISWWCTKSYSMEPYPDDDKEVRH